MEANIHGTEANVRGTEANVRGTDANVRGTKSKRKSDANGLPFDTRSEILPVSGFCPVANADAQRWKDIVRN